MIICGFGKKEINYKLIQLESYRFNIEVQMVVFSLVDQYDQVYKSMVNMVNKITISISISVACMIKSLTLMYTELKEYSYNYVQKLIEINISVMLLSEIQHNNHLWYLIKFYHLFSLHLLSTYIY